MFQIFVLVSVTVSIFQNAHCQSLEGDVDRPLRSRYLYANIEDIKQDGLRSERQLQYYKPIRQAQRYEYKSVDNDPEIDYNYPTKYNQPTTENYPYVDHRNYQQLLKANKFNGLRIPAIKKPKVQQYLKEVTPTTKTVYNQENYLRFTGQQHHGASLKQDRTEANQNNAAAFNPRASPFQYVLQSELQQQKEIVPQTVQYEVPEARKPQPEAVPRYQSPRPFNLVAYQNALQTHQKLLNSENPEEKSRSSIYVSQNIPKKPIKTKVPVHEQEPLEQEQQNANHYSLLQQYKPQVFETVEQDQQLPVKYQARLPVQQQQTEEQPTVQYEDEKYAAQYYQAKQQALKRPTPRYQPVKYQPEQQLEYQPQSVRYQPANQLVYKYQDDATKDLPIHQQRAALQANKYLPEPKALRYQTIPLEETASAGDENYPSREKLLLKYRQSLPKYETTPDEGAVASIVYPKHSRQPQVQRYQERVQPQPQPNARKYHLQYTEESQLVPQQVHSTINDQRELYAPVGDNGGRNPIISYRQTLPNSNVRYYRNLGRATIY